MNQDPRFFGGVTTEMQKRAYEAALKQRPVNA